MRVLNGIDVLLRNGAGPLKDKRIGLITNHTGLTRDLLPTVDALHEHPDITLAALFGPEHGIRGELDDVVPDSVDEKTGLKVFSLYGKHKKPTPEMLDNVEALVFDIQDIGCRFYTYISTLGLTMEAAAENKIPIVVLDRVNPINGVDVEGPVADSDRLGFTAFHEIPLRHGCTVGELAMIFNDQRKVGAELTVVKVEGWKRSQMLDATDLYWVHPSPNMRSLNQAILYPGVGLLETTNVSVGRGTDTPFELVGAPWIDGRDWAEHLNAKKLPGVSFVAVKFTPKYREFKGEICSGVNVIITDRKALQTVRTGLEMATSLRDLYGEKWTVGKFINLLANQKAQTSLESGACAEAMELEWQAALKQYRAAREECLLYD